ncbi:hypothetical protein [Actinomadura sp. 9N407]|uniref:hypothetical protein n=1 Tax=Actinomadura sp. 9N407 TaxID=3375154 RepID=UPI0037BCC30A
MTEHLEGEIEALYEVFGRVPRPLRVEGCAHCVAADEDRPLLAGPVRDLEPDVLQRYATEALLLWGDVPELRYFLPRLLEIGAGDGFEFGFPDPEIVFGKLGLARWTEWDDDERAAISALLTRWWELTVVDGDPWPSAGTVLCSLGRTGVDLVPFLDRWERLESTGAIRNLHEFVMEEMTWPSSGPKLRNPFWEKESAAYQETVAWLTDGRALAAVERAFQNESQDEPLTLLDEIHSVLGPQTTAVRAE